MYLDYYGFAEKPFTITPNPRFIFFSSIHKEAFALLLYGINNHSGFMELTGEVGTGKTTVLRTLLGQLDEETCRSALILNPSLSAVDLLRAVNQEFGISADLDNVAGLLGELNRFLLRENAAGRTVVLIIDEAQNLAPDVLEQIRLISNLETDTDKLIQIVLAGQPELAHLLERPDLRQLNQRIALRYHIKPLGSDETTAYIKHRLDTAGAGRKVTFTPWAIRLIHRYSRGTPRLINMLCDRALLIGYTGNSRKITGRIATLAYRDVTLKSPRSFSRLLLGGFVAAASLLLFFQLGVPEREDLGRPLLRRQEAPAAAHRVEGMLTNMTSAVSAIDPNALKKAVMEELSVRSEDKSALQAFNTVAAQWHAPPASHFYSRRSVMKELQREAGRRNLVMTPFRGGLDRLVQLGLPALIPLSSAGGGPVHLVGMTGTRKGQLLVSPALAGRASFSRSEFLPFWPGRAYLVWRNFDKIPPDLSGGAKGAGVKKLQVLLQKSGTPDLRADGIYEMATVKAVRLFQSSRGLNATGAADPLTLMLLYKAAHYPGMPDSPT